MGHQLIGFLSGCIQRYRVIHLVIRAIRHFFITAIHGRTGRINQMLYRGMPLIVRMAAGFQNVIEADHVALDVGIRVGDGVANASLGTQIDYNIRMVLFKNAVDTYLVRKVALDKGIVFKFLKLRKASFLDADIIVIVHVIQTDDYGIRLSGQNTLGKVRADKTG